MTTLELLFKKIHGKQQEPLTTFLNPYSYLIFRKNREIYENFDAIFFDGILLVKLFKIFFNVETSRRSFDMTSLAAEFFRQTEKGRNSLFFIGAKEEQMAKALKNILKEYPGLNVVGSRNGYFCNLEEREDILKKVAEINPDIVLAGMGAPCQEKFLVDLKKIGWSGIGYTCGGFFHQTAKSIKYYPPWADKLNLRWLFRIYDEPKLIKRYFLYYPLFMAFFLIDWIGFRAKKND